MVSTKKLVNYKKLELPNYEGVEEIQGIREALQTSAPDAFVKETFSEQVFPNGDLLNAISIKSSGIGEQMEQKLGVKVFDDGYRVGRDYVNKITKGMLEELLLMLSVTKVNLLAAKRPVGTFREQ